MKLATRFVTGLSLLVVGGSYAGELTADSLEHESFVEARADFVTKLLREESDGDAAPVPPPGALNLIKYDSPIGKMDAYVGPDPKDGKS